MASKVKSSHQNITFLKRCTFIGNCYKRGLQKFVDAIVQSYENWLNAATDGCISRARTDNRVESSTINLKHKGFFNIYFRCVKQSVCHLPWIPPGFLWRLARALLRTVSTSTTIRQISPLFLETFKFQQSSAVMNANSMDPQTYYTICSPSASPAFSHINTPQGHVCSQ